MAEYLPENPEVPQEEGNLVFNSAPCPGGRESVLCRTLASLFLPWPEAQQGIRRVLHVCLLFGISQCDSGVLCKATTQNHFSPHKKHGFVQSLKSKVKDVFSSDFSIASFWGCGNLFPFFQELVSRCQDCPVKNVQIHSALHVYGHAV